MIREPERRAHTATWQAWAQWFADGKAAVGVNLEQLFPRKLYLTLRVDRKALVSRWPMEPVSRWLERLRTLPDVVC